VYKQNKLNYNPISETIPTSSGNLGGTVQGRNLENEPSEIRKEGKSLDERDIQSQIDTALETAFPTFESDGSKL